MTSDPSATPQEIAHYGAIARRLTRAQRQTLEAVDRCGPIDLDDLTECWRTSHLEDEAHIDRHLDRLATGLLWKLEALGWVEAHSGRYRATPAGRTRLEAAT